MSDSKEVYFHELYREAILASDRDEATEILIESKENCTNAKEVCLFKVFCPNCEFFKTLVKVD